jgi:hypothetical protein
MLTAENGATMETDLEATPGGLGGALPYRLQGPRRGETKAAGLPDQGRCRRVASGRGDRSWVRV